MKFVFVLLFILLTATSSAKTTTLNFKKSFNIGSEPTLALIQDSNDFLWFGSFFSGLVRFDGTNVTYIKASDNSITSNFVTQIFEDNQGLIWVGTVNGLTSYDRQHNKFTQYYASLTHSQTHIIGNAFNFSSQTIIQDFDQKLWFGTQQGISVFDKLTNRFIHFQHHQDDPNSLNSNDINAIIISSNDNIWIATSKGLNRYNRQSNNFTRFNKNNDQSPLSFASINTIVEDSIGILWLGTDDDGLIKFNPATNEFIPSHQLVGLPKMDVRHITSLTDGRLALVSFTDPVGLILFDPITGEFSQQQKTNSRYSISSNVLHGVFEDKFGVLWVINTSGQVDKHDPKEQIFALYQHNPTDPTSLMADSAIPIYQDKLGDIYIGLHGDGLEKYNENTNNFTHFKSVPSDLTTLPHGYPAGFFEDQAGNFYIGTERGLVLFDRTSGKVTRRVNMDVFFYTMIADPNHQNVIWANGWRQGFNRLNLITGENKTFRPDVNDPTSFSAMTSVRFIQDKDQPHIMWIATWGGGLERFDTTNEQIVHHQHDDNNQSSIISNTVYDVLEDSYKNFWVTTDKGLQLFDKVNNLFTSVDLGKARVVHHIQQDNSGILWLATDIGLIQYDGQQHKVIKIYTIDDGLHGYSFFPTARGKTKDGQIWIGGASGLNSFYPSQLTDNEITPNVFLTAIKQQGEKILTNTSFETLKYLRLDYDNNDFEFEYVALNFTNSHQNHYQYKLEGFDQDWFLANTKTSGRYANLPSGTYTLKIRGSNNDGYWSTTSQSVQLTIMVTTPWWQTTTALFLYLLIACTIIYLGIQWRLSALNKENLKLEQIVSDRTAQLSNSLIELESTQKYLVESEKMAALGELVSGVAHELNTPLGICITANSAINDSLTKIQQALDNKKLSQSQLRSTVTSGIKMTEVIDNSLLTTSKLVKSFKQIAVIQKDDKQRFFNISDALNAVTFPFKTQLEEINITIGVDCNKALSIFSNQASIYSIFTHLLLNVINHAFIGLPQGLVDIKIIITDTGINIHFRDNGVGMAPDQVKQVFTPFYTTDRIRGSAGLGMTVVYNTLTQLKGSVTCQSEKGQGTLIEITIPCDTTLTAD